MPRHLSEAGKQWFQELEGLRTHVYLDSGGAPTIGVGHLLTPSERLSGKITIAGTPVRYHEGLTDAQCWALFTQDIVPVEQTVEHCVEVPLSQHQFEALCALTLNIGLAAFRGSTLLRLLNQGRYDAVPQQLVRWIHDNGQVVQGLRNRRHKEVAWWHTEDATP